MTARISKRTREQAALICDMAASSSWYPYMAIAAVIGAGAGEIYLAAVAYHEAGEARRWLGGERGTEALAAALLRDGWSPGDPVVRLSERNRKKAA